MRQRITLRRVTVSLIPRRRCWRACATCTRSPKPPRPAQGDKEFNTEAALLARLRHPHVVALLGVCAVGEHRIAVTELARGSLRAALDRGGLGWRARVASALGIARGVTYLHEVGLWPRNAPAQAEPG